ncbi:helix-turn-helix transcriptional regulator [Paramaledivibacter caminithermalis]|jgi:predicted transcriptional regulator YheO|uniref:Predicted transcriptional regulator YheO, contains PAS and DNA-binding HTH domains n=1 Tax=Paramaledivibacter caminithermalis (strain DSM 15212 / CIP 107654 / DViRD3) TaxID=1121301 RepID=A0A1M6MGE1_PARC5|nr:PAS domain-containing protein [Paramaledivibacter caminithermalis]SHJ82518.1 Predicted transcriptional regulator YheO, contains PAS and DNA-binding HTH domains [Paramaledivibacter caminithermalis DSM 15212]
MDNKLNPILKTYIPVVEGIAKTFGKNCEVVLHDFSKMQSSIIAIENGHVTGRSVGSPMTEVGLKAVRKGNTKDNIINYTGKSLEGRILKSSTMFIKDENDEVIGCLCINFDLSEIVVAKKVIDDLIKTEVDESDKDNEGNGNRVNDVLIDIVEKTLDETGKPVAYMGKEEKVNIVKKLDNQGAFLIKGAIDYVAKVLCVSRYTIYNYLDEIRVETK